MKKIYNLVLVILIVLCILFIIPALFFLNQLYSYPAGTKISFSSEPIENPPIDGLTLMDDSFMRNNYELVNFRNKDGGIFINWVYIKENNRYVINEEILMKYEEGIIKAEIGDSIIIGDIENDFTLNIPIELDQTNNKLNFPLESYSSNKKEDFTIVQIPLKLVEESITRTKQITNFLLSLLPLCFLLFVPFLYKLNKRK